MWEGKISQDLAFLVKRLDSAPSVRASLWVSVFPFDWHAIPDDVGFAEGPFFRGDGMAV